MRTLGVIPARYASTRFPAKVLAPLAGKPMIVHVWEKAKAANELDEVIVACDHNDVYQAVTKAGAKAVMTDPSCPSGSDRIAQAVKDIKCEFVINIQGDEPFVSPKTINALAEQIKLSNASMVTVIKAISKREDFENPNVVKCVINEEGYAMYFSRSPIPFNRNAEDPQGLTRYKHLGLYAYKKEFLLDYTTWPKTVLENTESLEQLRVLEKGHRIKTIVVAEESIAIDTPDDLVKAEQWLKQLN